MQKDRGRMPHSVSMRRKGLTAGDWASIAFCLAVLLVLLYGG